MLPIADDDRQWLRKIMTITNPSCRASTHLPDFARLQEGKYLLHYRNGEDWYDVHPLLRAEVRGDGNGAARRLSRSGVTCGPISNGPGLRAGLPVCRTPAAGRAAAPPVGGKPAIAQPAAELYRAGHPG